VGLAFLSPDLVETILQGRQPVELSATRLTALDLPLDWVEQRRLPRKLSRTTPEICRTTRFRRGLACRLNRSELSRSGTASMAVREKEPNRSGRSLVATIGTWTISYRFERDFLSPP